MWWWDMINYLNLKYESRWEWIWERQVRHNSFTENNCVKIADTELEFLDEIKYLGNMGDGDLMAEIIQGLRSGWNAIRKLKNIMSNKFPKWLKNDDDDGIILV